MFALHVLIARGLGADVLGAYSIVVGIMSVAVAFGLLGLEMGMLKVLPPSAASPGGVASARPLVQLVLILVALTATALGGTLSGVAPRLVQWFGAAQFDLLFRLAFLALPLLALNTLGLAMLRAFSWFPAEAAVNGFLHRGLRPAILGLLIWWGLVGTDPSTLLLFVIFLAEGVTASILLIVLLSRLRGAQPHGFAVAARRLRSTLRFSLPVMPAMTVQAGLQHADLIVIGVLATVADAGIFRAASLLALTLALIMRSFGAAFAPMISEDHAANQHVSLRDGYRNVAFLIFSASLPVFFLFAVNRVWLMGLFGPEFATAGASILVILAAGQLVNASTGQVGYMLLLAGSRNAFVWTALMAIGFVVLFTAIGYEVGGLPGAAAGSALATAGINLLRAAVVHSRLQVHPFSGRLLRVAGYGILATACAMGIEAWLSPPPWMTLVTSAALVAPFVIPFSDRMLVAIRAARSHDGST